MKRPPSHRFTFHSLPGIPGISPSRLLGWLLLLIVLVVTTLLTTTLAQAQSNSINKQEDQTIQNYALPKAPQAPVYRSRVAPPIETAPSARTTAAPPAESTAAPRPVQARRSNAGSNDSAPQPDTDHPPTPIEASSNQYTLQFNRSPVVGNRLRLQGLYASARLAFTRPRSWKIQSVKALIRFQHSPALYANRSNLTVLVNGTSVGSVPLNRRESQIGSALFDVPLNLIQNYNELSMVAQQHSSATCSKDNPDSSADQTLWTEILPDSQLIFNFQPQPVTLDFNRYPYPFFDNLSLDTNHIAYLLPTQIGESWLTAASRFQASLGRLADFRPVDTRLLTGVNQVQTAERLVIIGTLAEQPALRQLKLPFSITGNSVLAGDRTPLPDDVGVLMLTTTKSDGVPVLVATGNGALGVAKAVQALVQSQDRQMGTGQAMLVPKLTDVPTPSARAWPRYLPEQNSFQLSELKTDKDKPFTDVTVRGSGAPPVEFDFRALPDDRFTRGSSMSLRYSYGPQINPRTSAVNVSVDGVFIGGDRLTSESGETHKTLNVNLPENLIQPTSKLQVSFLMNSREPADICGQTSDQQLVGTVHADTSFHLNRETSVQLPDLKLLQVGFPFGAPQDLSNTAIVVPDSPSTTELMTLMQLSERLGRLSQADSVRLEVYMGSSFPDSAHAKNLVGIGTRARFPLPKALDSDGFKLSDIFSRSWGGGAVQTLPDNQGLIKETISPWNGDRVLLALTAQTDTGLDRVRQVLKVDSAFLQLQQDTALIASDEDLTSDSDYDLKFLHSEQQHRLEHTNLLSRGSHLLQDHWLLLPIGMFGMAILLYGIAQLYIKRLTVQDKH